MSIFHWKQGLRIAMFGVASQAVVLADPVGWKRVSLEGTPLDLQIPAYLHDSKERGVQFLSDDRECYLMAITMPSSENGRELTLSDLKSRLPTLFSRNLGYRDFVMEGGSEKDANSFVVQTHQIDGKDTLYRVVHLLLHDQWMTMTTLAASPSWKSRMDRDHKAIFASIQVAKAFHLSKPPFSLQTPSKYRYASKFGSIHFYQADTTDPGQTSDGFSVLEDIQGRRTRSFDEYVRLRLQILKRAISGLSADIRPPLEQGGKTTIHVLVTGRDLQRQTGVTKFCSFVFQGPAAWSIESCENMPMSADDFFEMANTFRPE